MSTAILPSEQTLQHINTLLVCGANRQWAITIALQQTTDTTERARLQAEKEQLTEAARWLSSIERDLEG